MNTKGHLADVDAMQTCTNTAHSLAVDICPSPTTHHFIQSNEFLLGGVREKYIHESKIKISYNTKGYVKVRNTVKHGMTE